MGNEGFFEEQSANSRLKTKLVTEYFKTWVSIMTMNARNKGLTRLHYVDLYAGKGVYKDGTPSTPIQILDILLNDNNINQFINLTFNEGNPKFYNDLKENIERHPVYEKLKSRIQVYNKEVDSNFLETFKFSNEPKFLFLDPFGYKGIDVRTVGRALKDFGSDGIIFFNYNRINRDIANKNVSPLINSIFGSEKAEEIRCEMQQCTVESREQYVVDSFAESLQQQGLKYLVRFRFMRADKNSPSHYLIFASKHEKGYEEIKEVIVKNTCDEDGFGHFEFNPKLGSCGVSIYERLTESNEQLADELLDRFKGRTISVKKIYQEHHVGTNFVLKNYRKILRMLELNGKVKVSDINVLKKTRKAHHLKSGLLSENDLITF
ncbi:three-Cys-motif partner protein TcmP [Geovibrio ferrireducens]|uniref:three-Cys-motif partner protein TcmP n=1 Tax=Geovibrio ferrireducens TaxID=46201 RepID=UPI0022471AA2|nr:three-Cys-motif partner protein TcmP [Geovibrio ferrireducens]